MGTLAIGTVLFVVLMVLLFSGVWIAVALAAVAWFGLQFFTSTPPEVNLTRLQRLQTAINDSAARISGAMVGSMQRILVEGRSRKCAAELMGRTGNNRIVNFAAGAAGDDLVGRMIEVRITQALPHSLRGEVLREAAVAA